MDREHVVNLDTQIIQYLDSKNTRDTNFDQPKETCCKIDNEVGVFEEVDAICEVDDERLNLGGEPKHLHESQVSPCCIL